MSSFSSPSPLTIPFKFRRKSSSASTSASMDNHIHSLGNVAPYSPPLSAYSPLLAPLHFTRRNECAERKAGDYFDDLDGVILDQQVKIRARLSSYNTSSPSSNHRLGLILSRMNQALCRDSPDQKLLGNPQEPPLASPSPRMLTTMDYDQGQGSKKHAWKL